MRHMWGFLWGLIFRGAGGKFLVRSAREVIFCRLSLWSRGGQFLGCSVV